MAGAGRCATLSGRRASTALYAIESHTARLALEARHATAPAIREDMATPCERWVQDCRHLRRVGHRPDAGSIRVLGLDPVAQQKAVREVVGVQLQQSALPARLRVREALRLFAAYYPDPLDVDGLVADWQLTEKANTAVASLSGGQRQRLFIALALVGNPRIVVLDELTTGLNPHVRREIWALVQALRDRGVTVLLVTHFMDEVERLCDRVGVIARGRITALGTPEELTALAAGHVGPNPTFEDAYLALTGAGTMIA